MSMISTVQEGWVVSMTATTTIASTTTTTTKMILKVFF